MKVSIFCLLSLALLAFSSCEKGEDPKAWPDTKEVKDGDKKGCFELIYPITYTMPDGSAVSGDDEKEVWTAIKAWYEANPTSKEKPALQYPVDVVFEDGTSKTIKNEESMIAVKKYCHDEKGGDKNSCFDLIYPITYTMPDGSAVSGDDEKEVWTAIKAWYVANPTSKEKPALQYPVDVTFEGGKTLTIVNEDAMVKLKKSCTQDKKKGKEGLNKEWKGNTP